LNRRIDTPRIALEPCHTSPHTQLLQPQIWRAGLREHGRPTSWMPECSGARPLRSSNHTLTLSDPTARSTNAGRGST
jgi:hypothetical protein